MPRPSCCMYTTTPLPSFSIICIALCSCCPQSQRIEPRMSPVAHDECTRTSTGSSSLHSPLTSAMCSSPLLCWRNGMRRKCPHSVGMSTSSPTSMIDSFFNLYVIRSFIVMMRNPHSSAIFCRSGMRAMVPSSFMISMRAPAGRSPARRQRSIVASVCPQRRSTPLSWAYSGLI